MKELKRPESIRIMGRDYQVVWEEDTLLGTSNLGITYTHECSIAVRAGQHPIEEADTLLHEVMHAVWYCMSISEGGADEESVIRRMASGLIQVLMDNGQLLKYFADIYNLSHSGGKHEVRTNKRGVSRPHGQRLGRGQRGTSKFPQGK